MDGIEESSGDGQRLGGDFDNQRPKVLNALDQETLSELEQVLIALEAETLVRTIVVTGAGEKAFVAGADIVAMQPMGALEARELAHFAQ